MSLSVEIGVSDVYPQGLPEFCHQTDTDSGKLLSTNDMKFLRKKFSEEGISGDTITEKEREPIPSS